MVAGMEPRGMPGFSGPLWGSPSPFQVHDSGYSVGFSSSALALVSTFCPPWELIQQGLRMEVPLAEVICSNPPLPDLRPACLLR